MATDITSPEKSPWGWKALIIAFIFSFFFLGFFYLAVTNEPDYMPSQKQQNTQQHAFKNAPALSDETKQKVQGHEAHGMSQEEHAQHGGH